MKDNPAILKQYLLAPRSEEYLIPLFPEISYSPSPKEYPEMLPPRVVAVYRPTGRGPFRGEDNLEEWEFEYQGIRMV